MVPFRFFSWVLFPRRFIIMLCGLHKLHTYILLYVQYYLISMYDYFFRLWLLHVGQSSGTGLKFQLVWSKAKRVVFLVVFCCCCLFRAAPTAYVGSQARGPIGAVAAGLHHSHSNTGSQPRLRPTPQLTATLEP